MTRESMDPRILRKFDLFSTVGDADLRVLAKAFVREDYKAGDHVFREGDSGDRLYLIGEGAVRISQALGSMGEEALSVLHPGQYFGDMSLIDARPRSADAIADTDCTVYWIDRTVFITMLRVNAVLAVDVLFQFLTSLCARLRENNEKIRAMNLMAMW